MDWGRRTVLITGAGGFIGSHLAERLAGLGARTRALVRYNSAGSWGWLESSPQRGDIEVFAGDVRDPDSLRKAMRGVDTVFHLAALIGIPYSYDAPLAYIRTNVEGTLNVLRAALDENTDCVVQASTSEVYGTAGYVPIDEGHPLKGQSPYSASKIGADKIGEAFYLSFGLPVTIIRPFNTYGPRQSTRAVIPTIITQAVAGSEVRLGSLEPTRDLNFVSDTVEGFIKAAERPEAVGQVINIGAGKEISVGDLAKSVLRLVGSEAAIVCEDQRVRPVGSEVERLLADNSRAKDLLGWEPRITLEEGLATTIEWMRTNIERYKISVYTV